MKDEKIVSGLDPSGAGIITIIRSWSNGPLASPGSEILKCKIKSSLPSSNIINLSVDYSPDGIDPESSNHEIYMRKLREQVLDRVQSLVNVSVETDPEIKSRKKMVQEVYAESMAHLSQLRQVVPIEESNEVLERVKKLLITGKERKHGPILVKGPRCSGKSSILAKVYERVQDWFEKPTYRIVRLCSSTPRSAYSLELLRVLCEHIGFLTGNNDGNLPRDASFDPLYLNNWLTKILRGIEEGAINEQLVIMIDDLHRLHPLECDIVAALSWLPLQLPAGVHFVVTTSVPIESLKLTPPQKDRLRSNDVLIELPDTRSGMVLPSIESALDQLERLVGNKAANTVGAFLAATEYGLSETEILELIMPTGGDGPLLLTEGQFNFATWCLVRRNLAPWLKASFFNFGLLTFNT